MIIPREVPEDKDVVVVQTKKIIDGLVLQHSIARPAMIVAQVLAEAMKEVPNPDYVEITLVRYDVVDKEDPGERDASAVPAGE